MKEATKPADANSVLREQGEDALREQFDNTPRSKPSPKANKPADANIYTADALRLREFPTLKRICGDIIVEGLTLLAARPKIGKTWLALDLAIAVDRGDYCLGDIKCEPGNVLFLALEDNQRRMQRRLTKLLGVNKAEWPRFSCAHSWPRADQGGVAHIRDWIAKAENPRLVVIDVLARFRKMVGPGKQSYEADYEAIAELQKIASETGVAILVIHHTRKGEADDPIDAVSGTLGLAGAADAILVIDRKSDGGVRLYGRSRDVDEIDKAMEFNRETCRWTILGENADVSRSREQREILEALDGEPKPLKEIATIVGKSTQSVFNLLERMAKQGKVTRTERGIYTRAPDLNAESDQSVNESVNAERRWW
jgi:RecA-family ATPase